jgi:hypothetical protein
VQEASASMPHGARSGHASSSGRVYAINKSKTPRQSKDLLDWDLQSHTAFTFSNFLFHTVFSFIFYFEVSCASFFLLIKITASLLPFRSKKKTIPQ